MSKDPNARTDIIEISWCRTIDGLWYLKSSPHVPGLWLWGYDIAELEADLPSIIAILYKHNRNELVTVTGPEHVGQYRVVVDAAAGV